MVLSIGMIVKNEEKYLEQCLTALKPILDKLDSELIIADTGSTDRTVEIAGKFTDKVYNFEWINDFAAARNSTFDRSNGEWYMFIDADEILQDCSDIIKFFKSGEYLKYNSASYIVRSYTDEVDRTIFADIRSQRLVAKSTGARFVGKVHEVFSSFQAPTKFLDLVADHYGYVYTNGGVITELARQKNKRNLEILFNELNEDNILERNPNIYAEISDCYAIVGEVDKSLEYIDLGLTRVNHNRIEIIPYYIRKIQKLIVKEDWSTILELGDEYFDPNRNPAHSQPLASDLYVFWSCAYANYSLKNYKKVISGYMSFFQLYKKYKNNKLNTTDLMLNAFPVNEQMVWMAYDIFFRCCYQEKMFAVADAYTEVVPLSEFSDNENIMENHLKIRVEIMENVGYKKLAPLYRQLDDFRKNFLLALVRPRVFKAVPEKRSIMIKMLASLDGTPSELAQIYRSYFNDNNANPELVGSFLSKYGSENGEDMLLILMAQDLDITPFVRSFDFFADRAVQLSLINYDASMSIFENYDITAISDEGLELSTSLYGWIMLRGLDRNFKISKVFEKYGELGLRWCDEFQSNQLPGDIRAAILVNNVVNAHRRRDLKLFRKTVEELKNVVPDLIPVVNAYCNEVEGDFNDFNNVSPEFAQLAIQVKQNIRGLIASRNIGEARKLIKEYAELCPNDPEIEDIKDEINSTLQ